MARYRGKREGLHEERAGGERNGKIGDPFRDEPVGDPFEEGNKKDLKARWGAYWDSGKGKILVTVLGCLAVFILVVAVVAKMWIKPPPPAAGAA